MNDALTPASPPAGKPRSVQFWMALLAAAFDDTALEIVWFCVFSSNYI